MSEFSEILDDLPSPIPAVIDIIRNIFVSPSSLLEAPLSRPVIQRLQWIKPTDDDRESYLYFNNMINHGTSGRIDQLRLQMVHAGPSFWQVCSPEEVEYKIDERCIESDGLCEVFARVAVWKIRDDDQPVSSEDKLGVIVKLESNEPYHLPNSTQPTSNVFSRDLLSWKYFDLQDLFTPGLDTRPWFDSVQSATAPSKSTEGHQRQTPDETEQSNGGEFWDGYESDSDSSSSSSSAGSKPSHPDKLTRSSLPIDPFLEARIRNTPVYRSKAPSVSSTNSDDPKEYPVQGTPSMDKGLAPVDLLSRISRTPLYKRAPSVDDSQSSPFQRRDEKIDLDQIFEAAGLVNHPERLPQVAAHSIDSNSAKPMQEIKSSLEPSISINPTGVSTRPQGGYHPPRSQSLSSSHSITEIEKKLANSLRAIYQLYSFSLHQKPINDHALNPGEVFISLAHRVVLEESIKNLGPSSSQ